MRVQVRFRGIEASEALTEYTTRRVHQHLSRFGDQVTSVVARLSDINGPRGGKDKRCQLTVTGARIGSVNLTETHEDLRAGVDVALDRLGHAIGRSLERARAPRAVATRRSET
jgi:ribosome-associated translation inhibitor RaiA